MTTTKHTINRRTALMGTVTLPAALAPAAALAKPFQTGTVSAEPANATDAAWAELQAAIAEHQALEAEAYAFEATLPKHLRDSPRFCDFTSEAEWEAANAAWKSERAGYPENPHFVEGSALDLAGERMCDAQDALLAVPAANLVDLERKVSVIAEVRDNDDSETPFSIGVILADVRQLAGRAAS